MNAAKFYWAVIGDASPEPVAVVEENGRRMAYTCGCADPFDLDGEHVNIEILESGGMYRDGWRQSPIELGVPDKRRSASLDADRKAAEKRMESDRTRGIVHGHRRFNP